MLKSVNTGMALKPVAGVLLAWLALFVGVNGRAAIGGGPRDEREIVKFVVWQARESATLQRFVETFPFSPSVRQEALQLFGRQNALSWRMPEIESDGNSFILFHRGLSLRFSLKLKPASQLNFSGRTVALGSRPLSAVAKEVGEVVLKEMTRPRRNSHYFFKRLFLNEALATELPQLPGFIAILGRAVQSCLGALNCMGTDEYYILKSRRQGALIDFTCASDRVKSIDANPNKRQLKFDYSDDDPRPLEEIVDRTSYGARCTYRIAQDEIFTVDGEHCEGRSGGHFRTVSYAIPIENVIDCCRRETACRQNLAKNEGVADKAPPASKPSQPFRRSKVH